MKSPSTKTAIIDGYEMKIGNPEDHENIKAIDRTTVYFLETFTDGSKALMYDNGCTVGFWCGVEKLKYHLQDLARIQERKNLIPNCWELTDPEFFKSLGII